MSSERYHNCTPKPKRLYRVTDDRSFMRSGGVSGSSSSYAPSSTAFSTADFDNMTPINEWLTAMSLREHLEWKPISGPKTLISVCGTSSKAISEANWRLRNGRTNVKLTTISTRKLRWDVLVFCATVRLNVLVDFSYAPWVGFVRATDLIEVYGLRGQLKAGVEPGARDEWFALDWIPKKKVISEQIVRQVFTE